MAEAAPPPPDTSDAKKNARRDWIRAIEAIKILQDRPEAILPVLFDEIATAHATRPALVGEAAALSYAELAARAAQYANWGLTVGLAPGDVVALLMPNCPAYVAIWFGLTRIGCVVALLNTNLSGEALAHCIAAAAARHVIMAASLADRLAEVAPGLTRWNHGDDFAATQPETLATAAQTPLPADTALLIYTSGTTGLPKAAKITHARLVEWSYWFAGMMAAGEDDRLYNCLPMYHSVGGVVAVGAMLVSGGAVVIREKFSARRFWDDVVAERCTIFQYIGELCRYLTQLAPHPRETAHRLRLCCGNGLAGAVWEVFQARFEIPRILEYYAATEGNVSLYNVEGRPGAIGRVPTFLANRFPIALIRCDLETGEALRGPDGFCIACGPDEPGEATGKIAGAVAAFDGYTDAAAAARKILHGAFAPGDRWFRTGDLMRKDRAGYYYFVDRLGDTFRWKGENVSTTEVAAVVATCPGVAEAVVYGVAVPGQEGRAGMAGITVTPAFSLPALHAHLAAQLPAYARPVFVRLCETLAATGTFKLQKTQLQREGFATTEPVFYDLGRQQFVPFTRDLLD